MAHLFQKNFSQHGDSAFKELCAGIGVSFEAAPSSPTSHVGIGKWGEKALCTSRQQEVHSIDAAPSDGATRLDQEMTPLQNISQLEEQLSAAEASKRVLEDELTAARADCQRLTEERREMVERVITGEILLSKCMYVLASMPTSILELRDEIRDVIERDGFGTS